MHGSAVAGQEGFYSYRFGVARQFSETLGDFRALLGGEIAVRELPTREEFVCERMLLNSR